MQNIGIESLVQDEKGQYIMPSKLPASEIISLARQLISMRSSRTKFLTPDHLYRDYKSLVMGLEVEHFYMFTTTNANTVIGTHLISIGSKNATIVDFQQVAKKAILDDASALVFMHNHPSGNLVASQADKVLTKRLCEMGEFLGIRILDHLIFTDQGYLSLREEGCIS